MDARMPTTGSGSRTPGGGAASEGTSAEGPLQTVSRALDVLLSYTDARTDWGVYELAGHFGWTKSTAQRVLAALAARGFLWADPYTRRYSLGPAIWHMSALWQRTGGLARIADDPLRRLTEETGFSSAFAIPDGSFVRCVAAVLGPEGAMRSRPLVGELYPANAGATARAYFAFADPAEQHAALHGLPLGRYTDATVVDIDQIQELYRATARAGYALTFGEWDSRTWALAVPVCLGGRTVGSLSLGGLQETVSRDKIDEFVEPVQRVAAELGDLLASKTRPPRRDWRLGKGERRTVRADGD